jgi:hypothetical protein
MSWKTAVRTSTGPPAPHQQRPSACEDDEDDPTDLIEPLRMGCRAEAWVAPPLIRELRELLRYRAKIVHLRSGLKAQVHAALVKEGSCDAVVGA